MLSMTGYGKGSASLGDGRVVVEMKSVNHRFIEVRCRAARELMLGETVVERRIRERIGRGYITVNLTYAGGSGSGMLIDPAVAKDHIARLIEIGEATELCLADLIPVLGGAPDLFAPPKLDDEAEATQSIRSACDEAVAAMIEMRLAEGKAMAGDYEKILAAVKAYVEKLAALAESWPETAFLRIKERLDGLFAKLDGDLDVNRVEAEAAVLVDKADVNEEITRLRSHLDQMAGLLKADEPVGRQAEFLIQEMARETNTVASKASLTEIRSMSVKIKTELEKLRELVQNIE